MRSTSLSIYLADPPHLYKLRDISVKTFSETFEALNTPENFKKYIDENFSTAKLTEDLNDKNSFSYLLQINDEVIGYLKLNWSSSQTEKLGDNFVEIERIYVLKKYHGRQYGKLLLKTAIEKGKDLNKEFVWLGVWEKNKGAINFYERNDFVKFDTHIFKLGDDEQNDYLYKRKIS